MAKALRIGVVGVGFGTLVHIPSFQSEGLEVVAVCARRRARAEEAAAKFGIPHVFDSFDEMLKMDGLDAVSIVTPPGPHLEQVKAAIAAGKHVICEKPFAVTADEAAEMVALAEASGLTCMVAHEFRFASGRSYARELIEQGFVGEPKFARVYMALDVAGGKPAPAEPPPFDQVRDRASEGAGILGALGSHYIDGLLDWFGEVESVSAELTNLSPDRKDGDRIVQSEADNLYLLHMTFKNGVLADVMGSMNLAFGGGAGIEVYGTAGTLTTPQGLSWNPIAHGTVLGAKRGEAGLKEMPVPERLQPFVDDRDHRMMSFRLLTRAFLHGIETRTSPHPNFADALHVQKVLDACRKSAAQGVRVTIE